MAGGEGAPCADRAEEILHSHANHAGAVEQRQQGNGSRCRPRAVGDRGREWAIQTGQMQVLIRLAQHVPRDAAASDVVHERLEPDGLPGGPSALRHCLKDQVERVFAGLGRAAGGVPVDTVGHRLVLPSRRAGTLSLGCPPGGLAGCIGRRSLRVASGGSRAWPNNTPVGPPSCRLRSGSRRWRWWQ
eukprot:4198883-Lingulodinium_polyedra.AAC.2